MARHVLRNGFELYNADHLLQEADGALRLCRVPEEVRTQLNESARDDRAYNTTGCEIRFTLVGEEARITLRKAAGRTLTPHGIGEIYFGPFPAPYPLTPFAVGEEPRTLIIRRPDNLEELQRFARERGLPFDPALVRILLPYDWIYEITGLEGAAAPPLPKQAPSRRLLAYGSSITHGGDAVRPTGSYARRLAERLGADLIGMGFAGSAHMERPLADWLAAREDWQAATLEMGVNVIRSWEPERFRLAVERFLLPFAERANSRPVVCTDLFFCVHDIQSNPKVQLYRDIVRHAVSRLNSPDVSYVPGTELLTSPAGLSADWVHPSETGHQEIAERLFTALTNRKFKQG